MANISKIKCELASRHLYETARGKPKELAIVSGFLERLQLSPLDLVGRERPDFSFSLGTNAFYVGLELTTLNVDEGRRRGSSERETHSLWKKIAEVLRERLSREQGPLAHVYGSIFFRSATIPSAGEIPQFCDEVVLILRLSPLSELGSQISSFDQKLTPLLARFIGHIYVRVFPSETGLLWWAAHLQSGVFTNANDVVNAAIKAAISKKQKKACSYQWGAVQERWLLIYAAGEGLADLATALEEPRVEDPRPYTQIFLWDKFSETIHCLSPKFSTMFEGGDRLYLRHLPLCIRPHVKGSEASTPRS